jgi:DNA (cytosine-5)-methyltransferase 1
MSLLQGFPADYVFKGPLASRYRQIGDAVPPMISAMIANVIGDDADGIISSSSRASGDLLEAV